MKCRKVKAVIRFHKPSKTTDPEKYFHHVLMLYFPWREESDLIEMMMKYFQNYLQEKTHRLHLLS